MYHRRGVLSVRPPTGRRISEDRFLAFGAHVARNLGRFTLFAGDTRLFGTVCRVRMADGLAGRRLAPVAGTLGDAMASDGPLTLEQSAALRAFILWWVATEYETLTHCLRYGNPHA